MQRPAAGDFIEVSQSLPICPGVAGPIPARIRGSNAFDGPAGSVQDLEAVTTEHLRTLFVDRDDEFLDPREIGVEIGWLLPVNLVPRRQLGEFHPQLIDLLGKGHCSALCMATRAFSSSSIWPVRNWLILTISNCISS